MVNKNTFCLFMFIVQISSISQNQAQFLFRHVVNGGIKIGLSSKMVDY